MRYTSRLSSDRSNGGDNGDDGSGGGSGVNEANFGDGGGTSGDGGDGVDNEDGDGVGISSGLLRRPEREALLVIRGTTETADWSINMEEAPLPFEYLQRYSRWPPLALSFICTQRWPFYFSNNLTSLTSYISHLP